MTKDDFQIGVEFFTGSGKWRCTDSGTRVVTAIKLDREDERNYRDSHGACREYPVNQLSQSNTTGAKIL
jgi:hypothetical protein